MNREEWHNVYKTELIDMFGIYIQSMRKFYPNMTIDIEHDFHNFSRLIFHCSSGIMSEYTAQSVIDDSLY